VLECFEGIALTGLGMLGVLGGVAFTTRPCASPPRSWSSSAVAPPTLACISLGLRVTG